jgi:uncharacterized membrane protein
MGNRNKHQDSTGLSRVLEHNIRTLYARRRREAAATSLQDRIAEAITRFSGSMLFVYVHLLIFGIWISVNLGWIPGIPAFDQSLVILAMVASVEAIFLSTFILITQNRMAATADKRADLDVQISLLAEHEITELARLVREMARAMGIRTDTNEELRDAEQEVAPEAVLDEIDKYDTDNES